MLEMSAKFGKLTPDQLWKLFTGDVEGLEGQVAPEILLAAAMARELMAEVALDVYEASPEQFTEQMCRLYGMALFEITLAAVTVGYGQAAKSARIVGLLNKLDGMPGMSPQLRTKIKKFLEMIDTVLDAGKMSPQKGWKSSNAWDTGKNSKLLRENMGNAILPGQDAHHIVQSTDVRAAAARRLLDKYQIDINDAVNGVGLKPSGPKPAHHGHGLHSNDGIDRVTDRLQQVVDGVSDWSEGRSNLLEALAKLKKEIAEGHFP